MKQLKKALKQQQEAVGKTRKLGWVSARELHARRAGQARAAWLGFMRARRVRRVGEAVVARHPNPIPIPMPHPYPNRDL